MAHTHPTNHSLQKWLESISVISWRLLHTHNFHHTCTHPSLSKLLESNICYYFSNRSSSSTRQENTALIPIWFIPSQINIWLQNPDFYITYYMTSTSILHKPRLDDYKTPHVIFSLMSTVQIPTIQHTHLPPIIQNIPIITLHMSSRQPIKNHHNSQHS